MAKYGQFCSIAKALEVFGERWTPLIIRELFCGSARFNEIHRGIPRISPSLLSKRLNMLEKAGVAQRLGKTGGYSLTSAGQELVPVVQALGVWGQRWVRGQLSDDDYDPDVLMWDMRRRVDLEKFTAPRTCFSFEFTDIPAEKSKYWLVATADGIELCVSDPGFDIDLFVTTDVRTMTQVWNGDLPLPAKIEDGSIDLHGAATMRKLFQTCLKLGVFADVEPA